MVQELASVGLLENSFHMACQKGQFDVVTVMANNFFKAFSIKLNAQHMNGMTHLN